MPVTAGAPLTSLHDPRLQWTPHPPPAATAAGDGLAVVPRAGADLWSRVGPAGGVAVKSDGACLVAAVEGDRFVASVALGLHAPHGWDQAGLAVRARGRAAAPSSSPSPWWLKACVERVPPSATCAGPGGAAAVVAVSVTGADGWTDQSTHPLPAGVPAVARLRVAREGHSLAVYVGEEEAGGGVGWTRVRLARAPGVPLAVGPYALAPLAAGCVATFREVEIRVLPGEGDGGRL